MPHKHNADRRHRIAKMRHAVTNWSEYEAGPPPAGKPDAVGGGRGDCVLASDPTSHAKRAGDLFGQRD